MILERTTYLSDACGDRRVQPVTIEAYALPGDRWRLRRVQEAGNPGLSRRPMHPLSACPSAARQNPKGIKAFCAVRAITYVRKCGPVPCKILIVDDDADLRAAVAAHFEFEGFVVREAADGVAALGEAVVIVPDLVLLDLNLPRLEGPGVLRLLREIPHTAEVPVIVVSAQLHDYDGALEGLRYEAAVPKPCAPIELLTTVRSVLEAGR